MGSHRRAEQRVGRPMEAIWVVPVGRVGERRLLPPGTLFMIIQASKNFLANTLNFPDIGNS